MKVVAYHLDGSLFHIYDSALKASIAFNGHKRTIDKCIRGEIDSAFSLMWRRYNEDEIKENIPLYKKKEISNSPTPIEEIDEKGKIIKKYASINEASKELEISPKSIRDVLNKKYKQVKGHIFRYSRQKHNSKTYSNSPKTIIQYSLDGKYIKEYPSIRKAASIINRPPQGIQSCVSSSQKSAYGYLWKEKKE